MKVYLLLGLFSIFSHSLFSQANDFDLNDEIIAHIPDSTQILGLGDPTHQEGTITAFRIDLIQKLVTEKQFKVIAIEGNVYELYKAYTLFLEDSNTLHFDRAMYPMLNIEEMEDLYELVAQEKQKGNHIKIVGFDPSFSGDTYIPAIQKKLDNIKGLTEYEKADFLSNLKKAVKTNIWVIFRNNKAVKESIVKYSKKIINASNPHSIDDHFFIQSLKNFIFQFEVSQGTSRKNKRDVAMAKNVEFLQKTFPNEKIILFGSSTHLMKSPSSIRTDYYQRDVRTLGEELNKTYGDRYYYIAYSGLSGSKWKFYNKEKHLPHLKEGSIEHEVHANLTETATFCTQHVNPGIANYSSRFLGHQFVPLDLWSVMDMIVLIKDIQPGKVKKDDWKYQL